MSQLLHYHKCNDCLTPFSSTERQIDLCDCNGEVTYMGEVHGDNYVKNTQKPACDGRCTHACGPVCDCICGGANHGTGRMVQVQIVLGKVKAVGLSEEDIERAQMYRDFVACAEKIYDKKFGQVEKDVKAGIFVERPLYLGSFRARQELDKIVAMRQYDPRMQALVKFIKQYSDPK